MTLVLQDTLMAMESLFEFTQVDPNRNVFNILIRMEASSTPNWLSIFAMDKGNYTEMQHSYVSMMISHYTPTSNKVLVGYTGISPLPLSVQMSCKHNKP